jgi:hypothetical protein
LAFRIAGIIHATCGELVDSYGGLGGLVGSGASLSLRSVGKKDIESAMSSIRPAPLSIDDMWLILEGIFTAAWFERIWCWQEVALARRLVVLASGAATSAESLGVCAAWLAALAGEANGRPVAHP